MLGSRTARAAAKLWYVKVLRDQQSVPVPRDSPVIVSGADDPDRVLLLGNGPTHGWGTLTHSLALTGQLARSLTRHTDRPTDVRFVGDEMMTLSAVVPWLGDTPLGDYDLILVVLSMNDALRLTPLREYRDEMTRVLDKLTLEAKPSARIVVAGIHPVDSLPGYSGVAARIGQRRADQLNSVTRELVGQYDGTRFMDLAAPAPEPGRPYGSPQFYADWSEIFARQCAPELDVARALDPHRLAVIEPEHEWDWEGTRRLIDDAPLAGHPTLDKLVQEAKSHFGVDAAWVSLIDGDRQYYAANTTPTGRSVPLDLTHCRVTMQGDEPVIVENSFKDDRFKDSPLIDLSQLRFYAGAPIKNEEGVNIGTFCVLAALPDPRRHVSPEELKAWAARAESEVQRLAAGSREHAAVQA